MPSSFSASLRFELQFNGENVNTWGIKLNTALQRVDFAIAGRAVVPLSGVPYSLTTSNLSDDQARASTLEFTGTGATVTIPSVPKRYTIQNACLTGQVIITTGSGRTVAIDPGDNVDITCDGTNVEPIGYAVDGVLVSTKDYIAAQALSGLAGAPSVVGNAGKFNYTDGASMYWKYVYLADIPDYASDQATRAQEAEDTAFIFSQFF